MLFEANVAADEFASAVFRVAQTIWAEHDPKGYIEAWMGLRGFPMRAMQALEVALSVVESSPG